MRKFLIATHGSFANGVKSSLDIIIGQTENIFLIQAYVEENKPIEDEVNAVLEQVSDDDELIVFTDLMGGSITNQVVRIALKKNVHIVSGFNLPLLIDVLLADVETPAVEMIESAMQNAKEQIVYVNKILSAANPENE
jgi:fructoselysine and glucoselysine-specific PTS system IIA component